MANPVQGDDQDDFAAARDKKGNIKQTGLARTAKLSTFGAAFNAARKAGDKTFTYKGKKYTTEMADSKAKSDTDTITKGANKLYEERMGPSDADIDRIDRKAKEELKGPSEAAVKRLSDADNKRRSQAGEFGTFKKGGMLSASKRADGCAVKGKTRGKMV